MKEYALLNYDKRTGADMVADLFIPYQFWYTHSLGNWALRTLDRPSLASAYFRLRKAQEIMAKSQGTK